MAASHTELAFQMFKEGQRYLEKEDPIQASEKFYKAAEESIEALTEAYAAEIWEKAQKDGRWTAALLFDAVTVLTNKLGEEIKHGWQAAWVLHVEGFHEARLKSYHVKQNLVDIGRLLKHLKT